MISQSPPPQNMSKVRVDFRANDFDQFIWEHGYKVMVEKAIVCPCQVVGSTAPLSDCQNCRGSGYVFINPEETMVLISGIREGLDLKEWSVEISGDISVTTRDVDRLAIMDRLTLKDDDSIFQEILKLRTVGEQNFIFTSYEIKSIEDIFLYRASNQSLIRLTPSGYSINPNNKYSIIFNYDFDQIEGFNDTISIRYTHNMQYHIYSSVHDIRRQFEKNKKGQLQKQMLPNQYTARKAHEQLNLSLFNGTGIIDNSY